ncbi:hypothetical protein GCM10022205_52650 [Spinactinospora alkalitolerans]
MALLRTRRSRPDHRPDNGRPKFRRPPVWRLARRGRPCFVDKTRESEVCASAPARAVPSPALTGEDPAPASDPPIGTEALDSVDAATMDELLRRVRRRPDPLPGCPPRRRAEPPDRT